MIKQLIAFIIFSAVSCLSFGQLQHEIKIEKVFLEPTDTTKNYYTLLLPPTSNWKGYVVLIPGFGETPETVLIQSELPIKLAQNGMLTIIPILQDGTMSFGVDDRSQETLDKIIKDIETKQAIKGLNQYIGGFSIGGSCAVKYAQNAIIKPKAVFAIDPPLDFERFYNAALRNIRLSTNGNINQENKYMIARIEAEAGGTPISHLVNTTSYRHIRTPIPHKRP